MSLVAQRMAVGPNGEAVKFELEVPIRTPTLAEAQAIVAALWLEWTRGWSIGLAIKDRCPVVKSVHYLPEGADEATERARLTAKIEACVPIDPRARPAELGRIS